MVFDEQVARILADGFQQPMAQLGAVFLGRDQASVAEAREEIEDFEALAPEVGIEILDRVVLHEGRTVRWGRNWRGSLAVYRVKRAAPGVPSPG